MQSFPTLSSKDGEETSKFYREGNEMNKEDINWREEMKAYTSSKYELDLLENGPTSLATSWSLGALHMKWKKIHNITEKPAPDCSSSFKEWNKRVEDNR